MATCTHLDQIIVDRPDAVAGCEDCLKTGGRWVHLRVCRTCGHVGCCDSSPNRHASQHVRASDHPIVTSLEPQAGLYVVEGCDHSFKVRKAVGQDDTYRAIQDHIAAWLHEWVAVKRAR